MRQIIGIILFTFPIIAFGQGENYVLFSKTGDTLITRTSCYCKTKDTLTTYFNVLDNISGNLRLISVFEIREPNKNSVPCADFNLVPKDTLSKYGLTIPGKLGIYPKRFKIKSKVLAVDTATTDKGEFIYYRQIRHKFKIGWKTFYTATVCNISKNKDDKIEKPKIHKVFGSTDLKKYHFIVIIVNANIDKQTGKVTTSITHTSIIN
jgi:hypothetical protein